MKLIIRAAYIVMAVILLEGCAGEMAHREGLNQIADGYIDEGLANLEKASKEAPDNAQFRLDLLKRREEQVNRLLAAGDAERAAGSFDASEEYYRRVLRIEPKNTRALASIDDLEKERQYVPIFDLAKETLNKGEVERAAALLKPIFENGSMNAELPSLKRKIDELNHKKKVIEPTLKTSWRKQINLEFHDANLKIIFEALARSTGVSFILDQDVKPDIRTTIFLRQSSLENAINLLLQTNHLEKKVLDSNTILIYPNTPEKLKDYQELVVKGFYLANADVKQTQAMIKGLLKTKDSFIDEKLNLIVIRDTPDAIKLAEKLIALQDLSDPEVMLDVEILEVQRSRLTQLGIQFPNSLSLAPLGSSGPGSTTLSDLKNINSDRISANLGGVTLNLRREIGDVNILANPRIRARNREKAQIMIGDKVPVSTTTTTATGIVAESIQYLDVGIKLNVEPNVYLDNEVGIKIGLEVSSITNQVLTPAGSVTYQLGSRSANTVLRLKDGETQVLAGLINNEDRVNSNRVPGLGDIPILGRLFSSQKDDRQKTEIVLSITPHLIRNIKRPDVTTNEFWSGTELALRNQPLTLQTFQLEEESKADKTSNGNAAGNSSANAGNKNIGTAPSTIAVQWQGPKEVKVGEQFKLALKVKTDGGLRSLPFQLGFDPAVLQIAEIAEGPFFKQYGGQSSISSNIDGKSGKAYVSVVRSGIEGAQGDDAVAIFTFRVLDARPQTEVSLVSATPVPAGDISITPVLPPPFSIEISR